MENIFSFKRFWLLVRKHASENWTIFLLLKMAIIILVLFMQVIKHFCGDAETVFDIYRNSLILIGGIYTGIFFKEWSYRARAATVLMMPATAFEKFALVLFYCVVVFIPVFTVVFYGSHFVLINFLNPSIPFSFIEQYRGLSPLSAVIIYVLMPYIFYQSLFLLCTICFKQRQIVIAFGAIVFGAFIINILNYRYILWLSQNDQALVSNQLVFFPKDLKYQIPGGFHIITSPLISNVNVLVLLVSMLIIYLSSYFKIKEKTI